MVKFVKILADSIILWLIAYEYGKLVLNNKKVKNNVQITLIIILFSLILSLINFLNGETLSGIVKILCVYTLQFLFFKFIYDETISKCLLIALMWYLCLFIAEAVVILFSGSIINMFGMSILVLQDSIIINTLIGITAYFLTKKFKFSIMIFVNSNRAIGRSIFLIILLILITLSFICFKTPVYLKKLDIDFVISMLMLLGFSIMAIFMVKQNSDIEQTTSMYQRVVEYSNTTNKVLENYRMIGHEHKNQLSIIRQMVNKDNTELLEYLDSLIEKRNDIKYKWVAELNKLPLEGLKGLINYKLIEAEENGINISVVISKDVSKIKLNKLSTSEKDHLYSIVGVYLDNAIQAATKSKLKEISIEIYKENKELVFILGNTFSGKVELEKLDDYGYSTKGKNHGVGLHLIKTIIDEDRLFSQSRKIIDNYFIQELKINISELNKKKK